MSLINPNIMNSQDYFSPSHITAVLHKQYEALRAFFYEKQKAEVVAQKYGYKLSAFYSLVRDFKKHLKENPHEDYFFREIKVGKKPTQNNELDDFIIAMRKQNFSIPEIVAMAQAKKWKTSDGYVYELLQKEGFARLPRRSKKEKPEITVKIEAPKAARLENTDESFSSDTVSILSFLPLLKKYGIDDIIQNSLYPETKDISRMSSILSFLALKLSNVRRYSVDDLWCMNRGLGMFAGLNVLPKASWFTSYSHRVTKEMNLKLLKDLHQIWKENDLLSDTANLDFTTIPYWGEDSHLENNWSGKRNKALPSILAVLAQDPESGIIDYGNADVMHKNESAVVLEYLDFYRTGGFGNHLKDLKYLVFDSKFTNYENLSKLDEDDIKFITIRRRGQKILEDIKKIPATEWKTIRIEAAGNKKRTLKICDQRITLEGYLNKDGSKKEIRQIVITGNGKIKPALIITNDFDISAEKVVRKYARRWLVEKVISEQIQFFHLNNVSSSMVIKVDFDLTMTILAHNLYRLLALELGRYSHLSSPRLFEKFIYNGGFVEVKGDTITVKLKKKRDLPLLLEILVDFHEQKYEWLYDKKIIFEGASTS